MDQQTRIENGFVLVVKNAENDTIGKVTNGFFGLYESSSTITINGMFSRNFLAFLETMTVSKLVFLITSSDGFENKIGEFMLQLSSFQSDSSIFSNARPYMAHVKFNILKDNATTTIEFDEEGLL